MQKIADVSDISVLFFSAGANFWAIFGPIWAILGHFRAIFGHFWISIFEYFKIEFFVVLFV